MTDQHPITPPPNQLVDEWKDKHEGHMPEWIWRHVAADAARWGADQELEACCEWFVRDWTDIETADKLRASRRPKPPSLKEQSLALIDKIQSNKEMWQTDELDVVRRALEQLPN